MDKTTRYADLARDVRLVWESLYPLTQRLERLDAYELATDAFDAECKLIHLHDKLLNRVTQPTPSEDRADDGIHPQLPF